MSPKADLLALVACLKEQGGCEFPHNQCSGQSPDIWCRGCLDGAAADTLEAAERRIAELEERLSHTYQGIGRLVEVDE